MTMRLTRTRTLVALLAATLLVFPILAAPAHAGQNPFIGEIMIFAGNFAPRSWSLCDGQLVAVSSNDALFSLLGTTYGGDGRTTFGLPDLRGRMAVHFGNGPGLAPRNLGSKWGSETVTLTLANLPSHTHPGIQATSGGGTATSPAENVLAVSALNTTYSSSAPDVSMRSGNVQVGTLTGGGQAIPIRDGSLGVNYCIALFGTYPSRS